MNKFFICLLILVTACSKASSKPEHVDLVHCITRQYSKELKKKKGLSLYGYGGAMMGDVKEIYLDYISHEKLDVEEARRMYIPVMEDLLHLINSDINLRPYLHEHPFTCKNLQIMIAFRDEDGHSQGDEAVALVFVARCRIFYELYNKETEKYQVLYEEPYEEALEIVKSCAPSS